MATKKKRKNVSTAPKAARRTSKSDGETVLTFTAANKRYMGASVGAALGAIVGMFAFENPEEIGSIVQKVGEIAKQGGLDGIGAAFDGGIHVTAAGVGAPPPPPPPPQRSRKRRPAKA